VVVSGGRDRPEPRYHTNTNTMDLTTYEFPKLSNVDLAFSTLKTDKKLLDEAIARGYDKPYNPYNRMFRRLFFEGGSVTFKKGLDEDFRQSVWNYCRALMSSFNPKHEEKEAICSLLMSEILKLDNQ